MSVTHQHLDLRGLKCPQPVLRIRRRLRAMSPGAILTAECTDPLSVIDVPHLVDQMGAELLGTTRDREIIAFRIRVGGLPPTD